MSAWISQPKVRLSGSTPCRSHLGAPQHLPGTNVLLVLGGVDKAGGCLQKEAGPLGAAQMGGLLHPEI